jgi:hypothetical protein
MNEICRNIGSRRLGKSAYREIHSAEGAGWRGVGVPREMRDDRLPPVEKKGDDTEELLRVDAVVYMSNCIMVTINVKGKMMRDESFMRRKVVAA